MKKLVFLTFILSAITNIFSQETNIPSWPCTGSSSSPAQYINSTLTLKVIFVEFADIKHRNQVQDNLPAYTYDDFENLLFSAGIYASPNMYSPDSRQVFGSLHDYYYIMSDGNLNISGYILNNDSNSDNVPDWIQLDYNKSYYNDVGYYTFYSEVISKATSQGLITGGLGTDIKLAIIYAGHAYRQKSNGTNNCGLTPRAFSNTYIMSEQFAPWAPYNSEHPNRNFSHIGIHAHELGHLLGFPDLYYSWNNNGWWDLMAAGNYNGPTHSGECPAPISPQLRYEKGWTSFSPIVGNPTFQADYNLQDPEVFQLINSNNNNIYFLVETRKFDQTMIIGTISCPDYNAYVPHGNKTQGVLVWRKDLLASHGRIIHANGLDWLNGNLGSVGDMLPGEKGVSVMTPWSDLRTPNSPNNWIPNTIPSSNCGFEIIYEGLGYYTIDFYFQNPVHASPSYPKNLEIGPSSNNHPLLMWSGSLEPDKLHYKIYKKVSEELEWQYLATTASTLFEDITETYLTGPLQANEQNINYHITLVDSQYFESIPSDEVTARIIGTPLDKKWSFESSAIKPSAFLLLQNYPNPFNPSTKIKFALPVSAVVTVRVFNAIGEEVAVLGNREYSQGIHEEVFGAESVSGSLTSGVYFYTIDARGSDGTTFRSVNKMMLLK